MKKIIGIIPARKGSKGLKNKNIYPLEGKPLISYTIEAVKESNLTDCYCSTDSKEIANVVKTYGCEIILRPSELASDEISLLPTIKHAVSYLIKNNIQFDGVMYLSPTYPFRSSELINEALLQFDGKNSLLGINIPEDHPFLCYHRNENGTIKQIIDFDVNKYYRRQSYPIVWRINYSVCIIPKSEINLINNQLYNKNSKSFIINDKKQILDIDTIDDIHYAEFINSKEMKEH